MERPRPSPTYATPPAEGGMPPASATRTLLLSLRQATFANALAAPLFIASVPEVSNCTSDGIPLAWLRPPLQGRVRLFLWWTLTSVASLCDQKLQKFFHVLQLSLPA